jgi:predicted nuclease of restriction endonuclease-like RecB superfamily
MLTKELAIASYKNGSVFPDRLLSGKHKQYLEYAEQMVDIYRNGMGETRKDLHAAVRAIFQHEPDCPPRRIDAFCKLLDDASDFKKDIPGKAANLRMKVFEMAAQYHPLVETKDRLFDHGATGVKMEIAEALGCPWNEIEEDLFSDVTEYHRLAAVEGFFEPRDLLAAYNVAQCQVVLYKAVDMTVWASADFKIILRYAKLARLMHSIERLENGELKIRFDGPASLLRQTRRYGVAMAKFLPSLLACGQWRMWARISTRRKGYTLNLNLSDRDRLRGNQDLSEEFDSSLEENFTAKWGDGERDGWVLQREGDILFKGQKVFTPDFVLRHQGGAFVYMEIAGFWTPEYIRQKGETLRQFQDHNILLVVAEQIADKLPDLPIATIRYKSAIIMGDVLEALKTFE